MPIWIALVLGLLASPPLATLTSARSTGEALWFSSPALGVKGTIAPISGSRFEIVVITLGDEPVEVELRQFALITSDKSVHEPIAAGASADLIFPVDSIPLGREVGQILPSDAMVSLKRTTFATVMLEADAHATVALVFQVPERLEARALKLPGGAELVVTK